MDRRNFLRSMLGVAAATALPSEVWPFRKIFIPPAPKIVVPQLVGPRMIDLSDVWLKYYSTKIPDLIYATSPIYEYIKRNHESRKANVDDLLS